MSSIHGIFRLADMLACGGAIRSSLDGPAHFSRPGTAVAVALLRRGTDDIGGDFAINAIAQELLEGLFHQPVLSGVEGQYGDAPTAGEHMGELFQKGAQYLEFAVHINA